VIYNGMCDIAEFTVTSNVSGDDYSKKNYRATTMGRYNRYQTKHLHIHTHTHTLHTHKSVTVSSTM